MHASGALHCQLSNESFRTPVSPLRVRPSGRLLAPPTLMATTSSESSGKMEAKARDWVSPLWPLMARDTLVVDVVRVMLCQEASVMSAATTIGSPEDMENFTAPSSNCGRLWIQTNTVIIMFIYYLFTDYKNYFKRLGILSRLVFL